MMKLAAAGRTIELLNKSKLTMEDKTFVLWFALHTQDEELTEKLAEELGAENADPEKIRTKYRLLGDRQPEYLDQIEEVIAVILLYGAEEQKAVKKIADFLADHGVKLPAESLNGTSLPALLIMAAETAEKEKNGQTVQEKPVVL